MDTEVLIVEIGDCLVVGLPAHLDDYRASIVEKTIVDRMLATGLRGVVLDASIVPVVGRDFAQLVVGIGAAVRDMGGRCALVDPRPPLVVARNEIGVHFDSLLQATAFDDAFAAIAADLQAHSGA